MKGVITVGSGGGSGPTTAASAAGSNVALVTTPKAAAPLGRQAGHLLGGLGLFAGGALLALVLLASTCASPRLQPPEALATGAKLSLGFLGIIDRPGSHLSGQGDGGV
jgi:hypothetical protein